MADNRPVAPLITASVIAPGAGVDKDYAPVYVQHVAPADGIEAHDMAATAAQSVLDGIGLLCEEPGIGQGDLFDGKHPHGLPWVSVMIHGIPRPKLVAIPLRRDADLMEVGRLVGQAVNRILIPYRLDQEWTATRDEEPNNGR